MQSTGFNNLVEWKPLVEEKINSVLSLTTDPAEKRAIERMRSVLKLDFTRVSDGLQSRLDISQDVFSAVEWVLRSIGGGNFSQPFFNGGDIATIINRRTDDIVDLALMV